MICDLGENIVKSVLDEVKSKLGPGLLGLGLLGLVACGNDPNPTTPTGTAELTECEALLDALSSDFMHGFGAKLNTEMAQVDPEADLEEVAFQIDFAQSELVREQADAQQVSADLDALSLENPRLRDLRDDYLELTTDVIEEIEATKAVYEDVAAAAEQEDVLALEEAAVETAAIAITLDDLASQLTAIDSEIFDYCLEIE